MDCLGDCLHLCEFIMQVTLFVCLMLIDGRVFGDILEIPVCKVPRAQLEVKLVPPLLSLTCEQSALVTEDCPGLVSDILIALLMVRKLPVPSISFCQKCVTDHGDTIPHLQRQQLSVCPDWMVHHHADRIAPQSVSVDINTCSEVLRLYLNDHSFDRQDLRTTLEENSFFTLA